MVDGGLVVSSPCATGADCSAGVCDRARGRCVACRMTAECSGSERCEGGRCVATDACESDLVCTPKGQVCDAVAGRCVACNTAADCRGGPCLGHSCLDNPACTSSLECSALRMVCGPADPPEWPDGHGGQGCTECVGTSDCGQAETCRDGFCRDLCEGLVCSSAAGPDCGTCVDGSRCTEDGRGCLAALPASFSARAGLVAGDKAVVWAHEWGTTEMFLWTVDLTPDGGAHLLTVATSATSYYDRVAVAGGRVFVAVFGEGLYSAEMEGELTHFRDLPGAGSSSEVTCDALAGHTAYLVCALADGSGGSSGLYRFPIDGQEPTRFDDVAVSGPIFVSGDDVFWTNRSSGVLGKTNILTGQRTELARAGRELLGVEGGFVYLESSVGDLLRVPVSGGVPTPAVASPGSWRLHGLSPQGMVLSKEYEPHVIYEADLNGRDLRVAVDFGYLRFDLGSVLAVHRSGPDLYLITPVEVARIAR